MIWALVIIAIIIGFVIMSIKDKKDILEKRANKLGSLRDRYSLLLGEILSDPASTIIYESNEKIKGSVVKDGILIEIEITEMHSKFLVNFIAKCPSLQPISKLWEFPLGHDQRLIVSKIEQEVDNGITKQQNEILSLVDYYTVDKTCPMYGNEYLSTSVMEINIETGETVSIKKIEDAIYLKVSESNLKIGDDVAIFWKCQGKQGDNFIFKDLFGNTWELNKAYFSYIEVDENKKTVYIIRKNE
jgi:hypothetical protein